MWIAKIRLKHDCIIGNRCEKFKVTTIGTAFNVYTEKGITHSPQMQIINGEEKNILAFIRDLKKDKRVINLENEGNVIFYIEIRKEKIPSTFYNSKLIYVKPVFVDKRGFETWEVGSWQKKILVDFINHIEKNVEKPEILRLEQTKLTDIYYPHLMPKLTPSQKQAIELAFENGYYEFPKKINMEKLAKLMKISVPTFCEHLNKAEKKIMPDIINSL
ncbi:MAG: helix-turn-helix domain-containing protein [Candidatus Nanoarchaeia archaeon]|nr:helix-turn-helix domain-containing protein [Candidatus Nanoarchaeia archaeon]MDD5740353.1 helix-turn-helix domain-containing protein [Candidatus Nanoarchaeia archaeon]